MNKILNNNVMMDAIRTNEYFEYFMERYNIGINIKNISLIDMYLKDILPKYISSFETRKNISTLDILNRSIIRRNNI